MKLNTIFVLLCAIIGYFILPFFVLMIKNNKIKKILANTLLVLFVVILLVGVWGKLDFNSQFVTINFDSSQPWCNKVVVWNFKNISNFDLIVNIIMLLPIGMYIWCFCNKKVYIKLLILLLIGVLCGSFIEFSQFVLPVQRSVQLSDVVLNTISVIAGGLLGWLYQMIISKLQKSTQLTK